MAVRLFLCEGCAKPSQMDAFTAAELRDPLFYTCVRCGHQHDLLPEEVIDEREPGQPKGKRRRRVFDRADH